METHSNWDHCSESEVLHTPEMLVSPSSSNSGDEVMERFSDPPPRTLVNEKNYITLTEGCPSSLTVDELSAVVDQCKELVMKTSECSEERRWLVRRLIELRYQLEETRDNQAKVGEEVSSDTRVTLGHHFSMQSQMLTANRVVCDQCCALIMTVVQSWYQCVDCQYKCHIKCLASCCRVCAHLQASEISQFETKICPEIGLKAQGYTCAECKSHLIYSLKKDTSIVQQLSVLKECMLPVSSPNRPMRSREPRRCDYTGLYFCQFCHWNQTAVIPARVLLNWDFTPRPVSQAAHRLLQLTQTRPILTIDPRFEGFVNEICEVKKLRGELIMMKQYLIRCRNAKKEQLPWSLLKNRRYFLQDCEFYSMRDLIELHCGELVTKLEDIRKEFLKHIKDECKICCGQGYICEICADDKNIVFPFDASAYTCSKCNWVYHKTCFQSILTCSRCVRLEKRKSKDAEESDETLCEEAVEIDEDFTRK
ncbi:differentially expressed in FDCP 8 homolog [Nilaparvata lugens]|uniref:differentially expressed in FDCP 8 homolog n=1 Tax=Nilaparvata lugens TaxID=108931 RepID=UPI00193D69BC|nr:differentially expressed in FDCP 8 homolog [Nilaparvata lugens]